MGLYFEDFNVGDRFTTQRRTVTESDVMTFAGLSGDYNPLHTDAVGAKETMFGERIAHGLLGLSIVTGLGAQLGIFEGTAMALLNINWNFKKPMFFGDTIHAVIHVQDKRETSKPDRGILVRRIELQNQDNAVLQEGTMTLMVKRRPAEARS